MKPADVKSNTYVDSSNIFMVLLEYQNIKILLQIVTLQIRLKKFV